MYYRDMKSEKLLVIVLVAAVGPVWLKDLWRNKKQFSRGVEWFILKLESKSSFSRFFFGLALKKYLNDKI